MNHLILTDNVFFASTVNSLFNPFALAKSLLSLRHDSRNICNKSFLAILISIHNNRVTLLSNIDGLSHCFQSRDSDQWVGVDVIGPGGVKEITTVEKGTVKQQTKKFRVINIVKI